MTARLAPLVSALQRRRLRLEGLPPGSRRLAGVSLAAAGAAAALLVTTPLAHDLPGGSVVLLRSDAPTITRASLAATLLVLAVALAALAAAAMRPGWRLRRLTLVGVAAAGLVVIPGAADLGELAPLALPTTVAGLMAALALAILAIVPRPPRWPVTAALAAVPPLSALVSLFGARLSVLPDEVERLIATGVVLGMTGIDGLFVVLALWAVIEFSRGLAASSSRVAKLPSRLWLVLPALVLVKLIWLAVMSTGVLPEPLRPETTPAEVIAAESPVSLTLGVGMTAIAGWWLVNRPRAALSADGSTAAAWLVSVPVLLGFTLPQIAFALVAVSQRFNITASTEDAVSEPTTAILTLQAILLACGPAVAAYGALVVGLAGRRRPGRLRAVAPFLVAFAAWTIVPATAWLAINALHVDAYEGEGGLFGFVNAMTLDLGLTILVGILAAAWWAGRQRAADPPTLLAVLVVSTVIAYGAVPLTGLLGIIAFWVALGFPIVAQFAFDAEPLNRPGDDREARVLGAVGMGALATSFTLPMVALGFVGPDRTAFSEFARVLVLVPFAAVLTGAALEVRTSPAAGAPAEA
ncbi:MAG: hypothetical protein ABR509_02005 [Candidatus Limnocylindria bacterium]